MADAESTPAKGKIPCPHWDDCQAGCPLIRFDYKKQLQMKEEKVRKAFLAEGLDKKGLEKALARCRPSPQTLGYRNKAKWILGADGKGGIKMGIYRPGSHDIVDISKCPVHAPAINEVSGTIKQLFLKHEVPVGSAKLDKPSVRYLIVRYSFREKKLLCVFVTTKKDVPGLPEVFKGLEEAHGERVVAVVQNINADPGNVLLGEANRYHKKAGELTEMMGSLRVPVGPLSFLQVNSGQAAHLYWRVRELIGRGPFKAGLDLYSGVGVMAMHLAPVTKRILSVEEVGAAALEGVTASRRNRIHNVLQVCSDSLEGVRTFQNEWGAPDWVVLNPPRKGCDPQVLDALAEKPPMKLVYVSCNPVTLARDLRHLSERIPDLRIQSIEPFDMFPQTEHVECIVLAERPATKPKKGAGRANKMPKRTVKASKMLH